MRAVLFKYGLKQFARRPFASILLLFMFAAIILLIDFTLIKLDGYFRGSELIHDLCKEDCYKLSTDDTYSKIRSDLLNEAYDRIFKDEIEFYDTDYDEMIENGEITEEEVEKIQKEFADKHWKLFEEYEKEEEKIKEKYPAPDYSKLPYVECYYSEIVQLIDENEDHFVSILSDDYIDALNIRMKDGIWLSDAPKDEGYIPLVVSSESEYMLGDTIEFYNSTVPGRTGNDKTIEGKVVGIADMEFYEDEFSHGGGAYKYVQARDIVPSIDKHTMCGSYTKEISDMFGFELSEKITAEAIKLKDGITDEERKEFFKAAADNYIGLYSLNTTYENKYNKEMKKYKNDLVYISLSFLMAIIALIGISAINTSRELKVYSIYCIHGMTRRQCIGINAVYVTMLMAGSTFIAICVKAAMALSEYRKEIESYEEYDEMLSKISYFDYFNISPLEAAAIVLLLITSIAASMIIPFTALRKLNVLSTLKEN